MLSVWYVAKCQLGFSERGPGLNHIVVDFCSEAGVIGSGPRTYRVFYIYNMKIIGNASIIIKGLTKVVHVYLKHECNPSIGIIDCFIM